MHIKQGGGRNESQTGGCNSDGRVNGWELRQAHQKEGTMLCGDP